MLRQRAHWTDLFRAMLPGIILAAFTACLGIAIYATYDRLETGAMNRFEQEVRQDGDFLAYFFKEREDDLRTLSVDRIISAYFKNKALGMSYELGLQQSLYSVRNSLARMVKSKSYLGGTPIYAQIYLTDAWGGIITSFPGHEVPFSPGKIDPKNTMLFTLAHRPDSLFVSSPCRINGQLMGWVIGELEWRSIFKEYLGLLRDDRHWPQLSIAALDKRDGSPCAVFGSLAGNPYLLSLVTLNARARRGSIFTLDDAENGKILGAAAPIGHTPYLLTEFAPKGVIVNIPNPRILGALLLLFCTILFAWAAWAARKALEGSLLRHSVRLAEERRQRAEELAHAKSEFLANMSHEIRTPLNGILGAVSLLEEEPLTPGARLCLDMAVRSGERLLKIINDILDLSRLEAGKMTLKQDEFHLSRLVEDVVEMFAPEVAGKSVEIFTSVTGPMLIRGDEGKIGQVLINLVGNAAKFTRKGWITVAADVSRHGARGILRIEVQDTGPGIPDEALEHIFEAFRRAESSATCKTQGSGLGLNITKRLVELMEGEIRVTSSEGNGTTFTVDIPCEPVGPEGETSPSRGGHVILAIKHPIMKRMLSKQLRHWGLTVEEADSLDQASELLGNGTEMLSRTVIVEWRLASSGALRSIKDSLQNGDLLVQILPYGIKFSDTPGPGVQLLPSPVRPSQLYDLVTRGHTISNREEKTEQERLHLPKAPEVLLVEDNPVNLAVAKLMLERMGVSPAVASNGEEALDLFRRQRFDAILMDCRMPGMDGYEATKRIRAIEEQEGLPRTPIIALTAHALEGDREKCMAAGMDLYLSKPLRFEELKRSLEQAAAP